MPGFGARSGLGSWTLALVLSFELGISGCARNSVMSETFARKAPRRWHGMPSSRSVCSRAWAAPSGCSALRFVGGKSPCRQSGAAERSARGADARWQYGVVAGGGIFVKRRPCNTALQRCRVVARAPRAWFFLVPLSLVGKSLINSAPHRGGCRSAGPGPAPDGSSVRSP
jgi:hypothetical protein